MWKSTACSAFPQSKKSAGRQAIGWSEAALGLCHLPDWQAQVALLDEPTAGMDTSTRQRFGRLYMT